MAWNDDSWKDGYDAWKLRDPYDDYDPEEEYCGHEDYEVDILDGLCRCSCGCTWPASGHEIDRQIEHEAAYQDTIDREHRRQWWRGLWASVRSFFRWRRKPRQPIPDDDIPF
jgi:hypothetical protein